jgi:hypothetical protein
MTMTAASIRSRRFLGILFISGVFMTFGGASSTAIPQQINAFIQL